VDIYEDQYHQIWIATEKGVSVLKRSNPGTQYFFHLPERAETPSSSSITSLGLDSTGMIWVGTENKGLERFDTEQLSFKHFNSTNTSHFISDKIRCITISPEGEIYCGLWAGLGFGKLNPDKRQFTPYTFEPNNTLRDWYNDLLFDQKGQLYLGFWGGPGLTLFDRATEKFGKSLMNKFHPPFPSRLITCLEMDELGHLWMGTTDNGLHLYFPEKDTSISFLFRAKAEQKAAQKKIFSIHNHGDGTIWVGAHGLFKAQTAKPILKKVALDERYTGLDIYSLLPKEKHLIWLLTNKGLLLFNTRSGGITDYSSAVNLHFDESHAAALELKNGDFLFGGANGLCLVNPELILLSRPTPSVYLSSLITFDQIKIANIEKEGEIRLKNTENFFTIQIGSDAWGSDKQYLFFYKLEGFNKDWVLLPHTVREAHFTNVPPGHYVFRVKLEDKSGNKYTNVAECRLSIIPPYWRRGWFIALLVILLFGLSYYFWWTRMKRLRLSLFNSELNQKLLRLQMNPHFIFNSLSAIQNYIYSNQTHMAGNYLTDFAHLIRLILDNSRNEFIPFEKEIETISLYLKLQKLRFENQFDYFIEIDPALQTGDYDIPPMLAQPFLENAIEQLSIVFGDSRICAEC
jgi:streptogramin lyase